MLGELQQLRRQSKQALSTLKLFIFLFIAVKILFFSDMKTTEFIEKYIFDKQLHINNCHRLGYQGSAR
jgi:hypothetical protein